MTNEWTLYTADRYTVKVIDSASEDELVSRQLLRIEGAIRDEFGVSDLSDLPVGMALSILSEMCAALELEIVQRDCLYVRTDKILKIKVRSQYGNFAEFRIYCA